MRNPAIHIKEKDLIKVLRKAGCSNISDIISGIYEECKPLTNRQIIKTNTKAKRKLAKVKAIDVNVKDFQKALSTYLLSINKIPLSKLTRLINESSVDYGLLKDIAYISEQFIKEFNITPKYTGYTEFIRRGIKLMGSKYGLNKFKTYSRKIYEEYENVFTIRNDKTPDNTEKFFIQWEAIMQTKGENAVLDNLDDYFYFVLAKESADEVSADYSDYIQAQFEELSSFNIIPSFGAFNGTKAQGRYRTYISKKNKIKKSGEQVGSNAYMQALKNAKE